jgi:transcription initiation factor TFIID TATA-box-binding protein
MADLIVENLILSTQLQQTVDLKKIHSALSDSSFDPDQLPAVVLHFQDPSRVVFITAQGKMVCTGSKTEQDAIQALNETTDSLKEKELIKDSTKITPQLESLVVSKKLDVALPLTSIKSKLPLDQYTYEPSTYPWLEYHENGYSMLLFSSGNIVCTGKISFEESIAAFKKIEDTLTSIGCKVAE